MPENYQSPLNTVYTSTFTNNLLKFTLPHTSSALKVLDTRKDFNTSILSKDFAIYLSGAFFDMIGDIAIFAYAFNNIGLHNALLTIMVKHSIGYAAVKIQDRIHR